MKPEIYRPEYCCLPTRSASQELESPSTGRRRDKDLTPRVQPPLSLSLPRCASHLGGLGHYLHVSRPIGGASNSLRHQTKAVLFYFMASLSWSRRLRYCLCDYGVSMGASERPASCVVSMSLASEGGTGPLSGLKIVNQPDPVDTDPDTWLRLEFCNSALLKQQ